MRPRPYARKAVMAVAFLTVAAWIVPSFFSAERYRRRLQAGLERSLGRPVAFGAVSFHLVPRPGFSIENALVREDPAFGSEPFASVDSIECDLRWRSVWRSRLDFTRLYLDHPVFNLVRNAQGKWNVEDLLRRRGVALRAGLSAGGGQSPEDVDFEADDGRIDFMVGAEKKPFAITELRARGSLDRQRGAWSYQLSGNPIRTDLTLPSPGRLELEGVWIPGRNLEGPLDATLRARGMMIYDLLPIVLGHSSEIYGLLDAQARLAGTLRDLTIDGQSRLSQLHRWEQLPPSDPMPSTLHFRGEFDRARGRVQVESVDGSFAESHIHLTGSIDKIPASPQVDLVVAVERSRLEDFLALARRFSSFSQAFGISGRADGLLTIQGPWAGRRYGGFVSARNVRLTVSSQTFPVSDVALRIDNSGARLAPLKLTLAPRVELTAEGTVYLAQGPRAVPRGVSESKGERPSYDLLLTAKTVPLHDLVLFGRAIGLNAARELDARGSASGVLRLRGPAWPPARPELSCRAEIRSASLLIPGLTEPLNIPRARIQMENDRAVFDPVVAVIGTSVFTGRIEHQGERSHAWKFDVQSNHLSLDQGALWFDVLGHRPPLPLLERIPALASFGGTRPAASNLFGSLNAEGSFSSPLVTYRALALHDFRAWAEISGREVRVTKATFRAAGGRGRGSALVDLTNAPPRVVADVSLADANLQPLAPRFPLALRKVRGTYEGAGHFETRGLTREEMGEHLQGRAAVQLKSVGFGDFDPLQALAIATRSGALEPGRGEVSLHSAKAALQIRDRRVIVSDTPVDLAGARLILKGTYGFDGVVDLDVRADLRRISRRWLDVEGDDHASSRIVDVRLAGPFLRLSAAPEIQAVRMNPR